MNKTHNLLGINLPGKNLPRKKSLEKIAPVEKISLTIFVEKAPSEKSARTAEKSPHGGGISPPIFARVSKHSSHEVKISPVMLLSRGCAAVYTTILVPEKLLVLLA